MEQSDLSDIVQDYARFARKTCAQLAETVQTRSFVAQTGQFLAPTSLEKLALSWLKQSKLAPSSLKQDSFLRQLHLFFGSPDEVNPAIMPLLCS